MLMRISIATSGSDLATDSGFPFSYSAYAPQGEEARSSSYMAILSTSKTKKKNLGRAYLLWLQWRIAIAVCLLISSHGCHTKTRRALRCPYRTLRQSKGFLTSERTPGTTKERKTVRSAPLVIDDGTLRQLGAIPGYRSLVPIDIQQQQCLAPTTQGKI